MDSITAIATLILVSLAAVWDFRQHRIPNWLTLSAIPLGIVWHTATNGLAGLQFSLIGFAVGFCLLLVLFATGGGGGGDVKLMGAIGAWLGMQTTITVFILSAAIIAIMLVFSLAIRMMSKKADVSKHTVAFAIPTCVATLVLVLAKFTSAGH